MKLAKVKVVGGVAKGIIQGTSYASNTAWRDGDPCVYCGGPADSDEHVIPRKFGGKRAGNIVRACQKCNRERSSKPLLLFLLTRLRR